MVDYTTELNAALEEVTVDMQAADAEATRLAAGKNVQQELKAYKSQAEALQSEMAGRQKSVEARIDGYFAAIAEVREKITVGGELYPTMNAVVKGNAVDADFDSIETAVKTFDAETRDPRAAAHAAVLLKHQAMLQARLDLATARTELERVDSLIQDLAKAAAAVADEALEDQELVDAAIAAGERHEALVHWVSYQWRRHRLMQPISSDRYFPDFDANNDNETVVKNQLTTIWNNTKANFDTKASALFKAQADLGAAKVELAQAEAEYQRRTADRVDLAVAEAIDVWDGTGWGAA